MPRLYCASSMPWLESSLIKGGAYFRFFASEVVIAWLNYLVGDRGDDPDVQEIAREDEDAYPR